MQKTKRISIMLLSAMLVLSLASCANDKNTADTDISTDGTTSEPLTEADMPINIVQPEVFGKIGAAAADGTLSDKLVAGDFASPVSSLSYEWSCMLAELSNMDKPKLSYTVVGNNALVITLSDGTPLALYALSSSEPILLDAYWSRHTCTLLDNNELFIYNSESAASFYFSVVSVIDGAQVTSLKFGSLDGNYFKEENRVTTGITEDEFNSLRAAYPDTNDYSLLASIYSNF